MSERLVNILSRSATDGHISMWATLHLNTQGGRFAGWLCDSWTEAGAPSADVLLPRLHWLSKEDDQFHLAKLNIPVAGTGSIEIGPIDEKIEPRRAAFLRAKLSQWENEYLSDQG